MNNYQRGFKGDIFNAIFNLTGKIIMKVSGVYALNMLGMILIFGGVIVGLIGIDQEMLQGLQDPAEVQKLSEEMAKVFVDPTNLVYLFLALFGIGLISSWGYYFAFILAEMQVKSGVANFNTALGYSFRKGVIELFIIGTLQYIISVILLTLSIVSYLLLPFLPFILFPVALLFIFRFTLLIPAAVVGGYSFVDSIEYSLKHINWMRSLKLVGIAFLFFMAVFMASFLIGLFSVAFALIPGIGQIIQMIIQIALGSFLMAFTVSALTALYYRYEEDISGDDEVSLEDHLIAD